MSLTSYRAATTSVLCGISDGRQPTSGHSADQIGREARELLNTLGNSEIEDEIPPSTYPSALRARRSGSMKLGGGGPTRSKPMR